MKQSDTGKNIALLTVSIMLTLGITEIFLRWCGIFPNVLTPPYLFMNHEQRHYTLRPGFTGSIDTPAGKITYRISEHGTRISEVTKRTEGSDKNHPKTYLIGDSFAFGWGVPYRQTIAFHLNRAEVLGEWINLGVPGYGLSQSLHRLQEFSAAHGDPAQIIYLFHYNDPVDETANPRVVVDGIRIDRTRNHKQLLAAVAHLYHRSRLFALMVDLYIGQSLNRSFRIEQLRDALGHSDFVNDTSQASYSNPTHFQRFSAALRSLIKHAGDREISLLVMETDSSIYSPPLRQMLGEANIPFFSLQNCLEATSPATKTDHYIFDGHWSAAGHRTITTCLKNWLPETPAYGP